MTILYRLKLWRGTRGQDLHRIRPEMAGFVAAGAVMPGVASSIS